MNARSAALLGLSGSNWQAGLDQSRDLPRAAVPPLQRKSRSLYTEAMDTIAANPLAINGARGERPLRAGDRVSLVIDLGEGETTYNGSITGIRHDMKGRPVLITAGVDVPEINWNQINLAKSKIGF